MKFIAFVNRLSDWTGKIVSPVIVLIMALSIYEVGRRYFFSSPTTWVWEINSQLMCLMGAMAGCYTFSKGGHVSVDIVTSRLSRKARALMQILTSPVFFIFAGCLIWFGAKEAIRAYLVDLRVISQFGSLLWPVKAVIPLGGILIFLQGLANLAENCQIVFTKEN